jgi:hypothetical protein
MLIVLVLPPTLPMASRTVNSISGLVVSNCRAAERPDKPAPITITLFLFYVYGVGSMH